MNKSLRYRVALSICLMLFLYVLCNSARAQNLKRSKVTDDFVFTGGLDNLNQIYYINNKRQLFKLVPSQNRDYLYTDLFVDRQTIIYVHNPLKILLYKKDIGTLVTLDSRLNMTGKINLFDLGYYDVSALSVANDNQSVWLFDKASNNSTGSISNTNRSFSALLCHSKLDLT